MSLPPAIPDDLPELPPVETPTAAFIVQLFVIPAVVVAVVIGVWLLFGKLAGGERDVMDYVRTLKDPNVNRRWRAAYELASLIQNDPKLARDSALLGELCNLLDDEVAKPGPDPEVPRFLAHCLGAFQTLNAAGVGGRAVDPQRSLAGALDAKQPSIVRAAAAQSLGRLAARLKVGEGHPEVAAALAATLNDAEEPELRQRAAYTLGYLDGDAAGEALRSRLKEDEDRSVRYNVGAALARRGDLAARDALREMLSAPDLAAALKGENASETERRAEAVELEAIWALQASVKAGKPELARSVRKELEGLSKVAASGVKAEVDSLLMELGVAP